MSEYNARVNVIANLISDDTQVVKDIEALQKKPIKIKLEADTVNLFKDMQGDIRKIQNAVSKIKFDSVGQNLQDEINKVDFSKLLENIQEAVKGIDFSSIRENLASSMQVGANEGAKKAEIPFQEYKKTAKSALSELKRQYSSKTDVFGNGLEDLRDISDKEGLNALSKKLKKSLSTLGEPELAQKFSQSWNTAFSELKKNVPEIGSKTSELQQLSKALDELLIKNKDGDLSLKVTISGFDDLFSQLSKVQGEASETKESLQNLLTFNLDSSIADQFNQITNSLNQLLIHISQIKTALQDITASKLLPSSVYEEQIKHTSADLDKVTQEIEEREKKLKHLKDVIGEPYKDENGDKVKTDEYKSLETAAKRYGQDGITRATQKKADAGLEILKEYLRLEGKIEDLKIPSLTEDSNVVQVARENLDTQQLTLGVLKQQQVAYESQLETQKRQLSLSKAQENIAPPEAPTSQKKRKVKRSKNAIDEDTFLSVSGIAENNAIKLFESKNYKYIDLTTKQLESGLAKVSAKVKDASGEWRTFNAIINETGDLTKATFSQNSKKNIAWDKRLAKVEGESVHLSIKEQEDAINKLRYQIPELSDSDRWSISVDTSGFVTIKNNLQQISDEAYQAVQKFQSVEEAIRGFNDVALTSTVSYSNKIKDNTASKDDKQKEKDPVSQIKKITDMVNTNALSAQLSKITSNYKSYLEAGVSTTDLDQIITKATEAYSKIKELVQTSQSVGSLTTSESNDLISYYEQLDQSLATATNRMKELADVKKQSDSVDKILTDIDAQELKAKQLEEAFYPYSRAGKTENNNFDQQVSNMKNYLQEVKDLVDQQKMGALDANGQEKLVTTYGKLKTSIKEVENANKSLKASYGGILTESDKIVTANKMEKWLQDNTRAAKEYGEQIDKLVSDMRSAETLFEKKNILSQFNQITSEAGAKGLTGRSWFTSLKETFSSISQIFGSYSIVDVIQDAGRQMIENTRSVDDAMTQLQMATGVTKTEAQELMQTYSKLGNQLSSTGTDVAASSTEWLKQGESIANANKLAQDSIVLSKIGGITSEESTKYLTAAIKGYQMETTEAMDIVDKISTVDLMSATDVGGLAEGMSEVAANANLVGIEMDTLLGYLAAIGETTQDDMGSVGNALNTIFSRMRSIKLSRLKDYQSETGEDLSNVETVLRGEGISLRDASGQFRNFTEVLDETAARWNDFSKTSQSAIAQAFAGTNQSNNFITLMAHYEDAMKYADAASNSAGSGMEKFEAYTNSLSGKIEKFKNAFQSLSTNLVNSDFLSGLVDTGTSAINIIDELIGSVGTLKTALVGLGLFQGKNGSGEISQKSLSIFNKNSLCHWGV